MRKIFHKLHLWLSLPFGLIIFLICFSGAMLVFEKEVTEAVNHDIIFVEKVGTQKLPVDRLAGSVSATLTDGVTVTGVTIHADPQRAYQVNLSKPKRASVYVDQYTGEIKGKSERLPFFTTMFRLHRWLLDSRPSGDGIFWGKVVVGVSVIMFVLALITGIVLWWPKTIKSLGNRLKITMRKGWGRFWYDLHVAGGFYALILLLAMSLTGLTWSFRWYRTGFYKVFGVEMVQGVHASGHGHGNGAKQGKKDVPEIDMNQWQLVADNLVQTNKNYSQIRISDGNATVSFGKLGNQRAADRYKFDAQTGEITDVEYYADAPTRSKIGGWIYSVHVGSWGGLFTRILAFLASLFGASLPLTGYYLWIKRKFLKK